MYSFIVNIWPKKKKKEKDRFKNKLEWLTTCCYIPFSLKKYI